MELGRYLYTTRISDVSKLIMKEEDSDEVREIKGIIVKMLALEPSDRPSIQEVIDRLSQQRTSLGVHVFMSMDTVWKSPRFYSELTFAITWQVFLLYKYKALLQSLSTFSLSILIMLNHTNESYYVRNTVNPFTFAP